MIRKNEKVEFVYDLPVYDHVHDSTGSIGSYTGHVIWSEDLGKATVHGDIEFYSKPIYTTVYADEAHDGSLFSLFFK